MHPELIKAQIRIGGSTPSEIARELEVSRMTVSHVIHGRGVSRKIALKISLITGQAVGDLWPGKYPQIEFLEKTGVRVAEATQAESELRTLAPKATQRRTTKAARQGAAA